MHANAIIVSIATRALPTPGKIHPSTLPGFDATLRASVRKAMLDTSTKSASAQPQNGKVRDAADIKPLNTLPLASLERTDPIPVPVPVAPEEPIASSGVSTSSVSIDVAAPAVAVKLTLPVSIDFGNSAFVVPQPISTAMSSAVLVSPDSVVRSTRGSRPEPLVESKPGPSLWIEPTSAALVSSPASSTGLVTAPLSGERVLTNIPSREHLAQPLSFPSPQVAAPISRDAMPMLPATSIDILQDSLSLAGIQAKPSTVEATASKDFGAPLNVADLDPSTTNAAGTAADQPRSADSSSVLAASFANIPAVSTAAVDSLQSKVNLLASDNIKSATSEPSSNSADNSLPINSVEPDLSAPSASFPNTLVKLALTQTQVFTFSSLPNINPFQIRGDFAGLKQPTSAASETRIDIPALGNEGKSQAGRSNAADVVQTASTTLATFAANPTGQVTFISGEKHTSFDGANSNLADSIESTSNDRLSSNVSDTLNVTVDSVAASSINLAQVVDSTSPLLISLVLPTPSQTDRGSNMADGLRVDRASGAGEPIASVSDTKSSGPPQSRLSLVGSVSKAAGVAPIPMDASPIVVGPTANSPAVVSSAMVSPVIVTPSSNQQASAPSLPPASQDTPTAEMSQPHQVLDAAPPPPVPTAQPMNIHSDVQTNFQMHVGIRTDAFGSVEIHTVVQQSQVGITVHADRDLSRWFGPEVSSLESGLNQHHFDLSAVDFNSGHSSANTESGSHLGQGHGHGQSRQDLSQSPSRSQGASLAESNDLTSWEQESESPSLITSVLSNDTRGGFATTRFSIHV